MSDSESPFESELNAFDRESSDDLFDTNSEAMSLDAEAGEDSDVEIIDEGASSVPTHDIGNGLMTRQLVPLAMVYRDGSHVDMGQHCESSAGHQSETSTSGRGEAAAEPSPYPRGVRLPLQPAVQRILAQISYAPSQYNPNFWMALIGVVAVFGIAEEEEPSYEQFSYLYSVTKSKSANHKGWVQANCLRASERGHFLKVVPTSQKSWRNRRVLLSGDWESPSGRPVRFHIPTTFQIAGRSTCRSQPSPTQSEIRQIDKVRLKVPTVEVYPKFLFTVNLIKAELVSPAEMTDARRAAEAKRMNESSKRRLMMGLQGMKKNQQAEAVPVPSAGVDPEDQTLADHLRQLHTESTPSGAAEANSTSRKVPTTEAVTSKAAHCRPRGRAGTKARSVDEGAECCHGCRG
ncbi:unnamed protein product [Prunus armeniaca]